MYCVYLFGNILQKNLSFPFHNILRPIIKNKYNDILSVLFYKNGQLPSIVSLLNISLDTDTMLFPMVSKVQAGLPTKLHATKFEPL